MAARSFDAGKQYAWKVSFYAGSTLSLFEGFSLDVRAEHSLYRDWRARANNFKELVFITTLSVQW